MIDDCLGLCVNQPGKDVIRGTYLVWVDRTRNRSVLIKGDAMEDRPLTNLDRNGLVDSGPTPRGCAQVAQHRPSVEE